MTLFLSSMMLRSISVFLPQFSLNFMLSRNQVVFYTYIIFPYVKLLSIYPWPFCLNNIVVLVLWEDFQAAANVNRSPLNSFSKALKIFGSPFFNWSLKLSGFSKVSQASHAICFRQGFLPVDSPLAMHNGPLYSQPDPFYCRSLLRLLLPL